MDDTGLRLYLALSFFQTLQILCSLCDSPKQHEANRVCRDKAGLVTHLEMRVTQSLTSVVSMSRSTLHHCTTRAERCRSRIA